MQLGSLIHQAISHQLDESLLETQILNLGLMPDKVRIAKQLVSDLKVSGETEVKVFTQLEDIKIFSILDAFDGETLTEHKTRNGWWTQAEVDEHLQLTFYAMVIQLKFKKLPSEIVLNSLNTSNGKIKSFKTTRSQEQVNKLKSAITEFKAELENLGWWKNRVSHYD